MTEICAECRSERPNNQEVCPTCGARAQAGEHRHQNGNGGSIEDVRTSDLEPYIALAYIAKLFKLLAALILVMLLGEVVTGLLMDGRSALMTLLGEATRLLVLAGMLWAGGDIALLMIDAGHDLRVARILLGRMNSKLHEEPGFTAGELGNPDVKSGSPGARS